jgi:hypothetical protein
MQEQPYKRAIPSLLPIFERFLFGPEGDSDMKDWKQRSDDDAGKFNDEKFENGGRLDPASAQRWGDRARDLKAEAEQEVIAQRDARDEAERLLRAAQAAVDTYGRLRQEATRMVRASAMTAGERAGYV